MANGSVAIVVGALATIALFLSGCGGSGGGGGETHACVNTKFDIPTQSFSGTSSVTMDVGAIKEKVMGTESVMFDREKLNIRENSASSVTVNGTTVSVNMKAFFSLPKMLAAASIDMNVNGKKNNTCGYIDLSKMKNFPPAQQIKAGVDLLVQMMAAQMKCTGNDGTYDTFVMDEKIPNPNIPLPKNLSGLKGEIKEQMQCDKSFMLHSTSVTIDMTTPAQKIGNQTIPAQTIHEDVALTVDGGVAKPQGPTDADLDYSSWGKCTEVPPPSSLADFFKPSRSRAFDAVKLRHHDPKPSLFFGLVLGAVDEHLQKLSKPAVTEMV
jgi:hypothetical protein